MNKQAELRKIAIEIETCALCSRWGKGRAVPGEGNADADIAFIGEAPGQEEARSGRPFVGRSGRLLRGLIRDIGIDEAEVFITSPVQRLPLLGTPSLENVRHSRQHLMKQLSVVNPKIVVLLGATACYALLKQKVSVTADHGKVIQSEGRTYFITLHPAYAVRFPARREELIADFRKLKRLIAT